MLDEFSTALEDEGYNVIDTDEHHDADKHGTIFINHPITIEGEQFNEAELLIDVYFDDIDSRGIDIHCFEDDEIADEREELLDSVATHRDILENDAVAWTVYSSNADTNIDDVLDELKDVFRVVPTS